MALLVRLPPAGKLVIRTGMVMVAWPVPSSWPSAQFTVRPVAVQVPVAG